MVILHIANSYGGTAVYTNLYTAIDANMDVEQWIYVPLNSRNHGRVGNMMIDFKNQKSKIIYSTILKPWHRYLYGMKIRSIVRDIERRFDLSRVDVIHAGSLCLDGAVAYELSKKYNIPYITAVRGTDKTYYRLKWRLGYFTRILKDASQVVFISPKFKDVLLNKYVKNTVRKEIERNTIVIPNGVGQIFLSNMNLQRRKLDGKTLHLIFIAAFYKGKGLIETILAIDELRKKGYDITLNAIGKGLPNRPFDENYMKQVESVSCNKEWVRLQPFMPPAALIDEMRQADAFIMVSSPETFGLVYVEALSQGLPVIYAKDEGFDGFYPDGFVGYAAKAGNVASIARGIELFIKNYGTMANNVLSLNLKERFDWNAIALHYINLYNSCIRK